MPSYWVYYRKNPTFRVDKKLTAEDVIQQRTHVLVTLIDRENRDAVFRDMQAPLMSTGSKQRVEEARKRSGVSLHTSMSVGDCVCASQGMGGRGTMYQVTNDGWAKVL